MCSGVLFSTFYDTNWSSLPDFIAPDTFNDTSLRELSRAPAD